MPEGPTRRRLLWDCSHLAALPYLNTGIERVVRELGAALIETGPAQGFELVPCVTDGTSRISRVDIPGVSDPPAEGQEPVGPAAGDVWMLADNAWDPARLIGISPWWRQGMSIVLVQYDLVPLRHPDTTTPLTAALFARWLFEAVAFADGFVSISQATRTALAESLEDLAPWRSFADAELPVAHLASTWRPERGSSPPAPGEPWRLVAVGTVEPRKRYDLLLDAFEEHWRGGGRTELHIVGRKGWNSTGLQKRLAALEQAETRFAWLGDADDDQLREEYLAAHALVSLSSEEGFGLPVIEAAAAGLPLILSDIRVYREVAGDQAEYVPLPPDAARRQLVTLLDGLDRGTATLAAAPEGLAARTWQDTARELLDALAAMPPPNARLRERWDQRAALALAAAYGREPAGAAGSGAGGPAGGGSAGSGGSAVGSAGSAGPPVRRRLAEGYSRLRLRLPQTAVRMMHVRNQLFRLAQQLDSRTSVIEARLAALAHVYPTANALQSMRAAEADHVLRYELEAILTDVERLVEELSPGEKDGAGRPAGDYDSRIARIRGRLRTRGDGQT